MSRKGLHIFNVILMIF